MRSPSRRAPRLILYAGLMGVLFYYGLFFYQSATGDATGLSTGVGFWLALLGGLALIVQVVVPRPAAVEAEEEDAAPFTFTGRRWRRPFAWAGHQLSRLPVLAYLGGLLLAALLERLDGRGFARLLGFGNKVPSFFGATDILEPFGNLDFSGILAPLFPTGPVEAPLQQSGQAIGTLINTFIADLFYHGPREPGFFDTLLRVTIYDIVVFVIPIIVFALLLRSLSYRSMDRLPRWMGYALQIGLLFLVAWLWGGLSDYRNLVLMYIGINIMMSASLNLVNGYMGEFSVGHAGFMAVGAYVSSLLTMIFLVDTRTFGPALIPLNTMEGLGADVAQWVGLLLALLIGGIAAALVGLLVAFPSFKTRGDYLAIVTLAVNFIVKSTLENIQEIGGARGLNGVPLWSTPTWVFFVAVASVVVIYNLVSSVFGKGISAIREDEVAAELMGVHTRRVKLVAFLVSSFIAGMAGGLLAHTLGYINPGTFDIKKSTEALVMVYLGGMGSISGSIIAAVIFTVMLEALRPLAILKWVLIPLILILLMLYRPQGLFGFRELKLNFGRRRGAAPARLPTTEAADGAAGD